MGTLPSRVASILRRLASLLAVLAISFTLGELALRLYHRLSPSFIFYDDSYNRFRGIPGSDVHGFRINSLGFNDLEFQLDKGERHRILALGDSFSFGVVPYPDNYLTLLEQRLDYERPPVEVLNMGIPRIGPVEELALLLGEGLRLDPDRVLLSFYLGNDFFDVRRYLQAKQTLVNRSYVLSLLRYAMMIRPEVDPETLYGQRAYQDDAPTFDWAKYLGIIARQSSAFRTNSELLPEVFERTILYLDEIRSACDDRGIELTVVLIPTEVQVDPSLQRRLIASRPAYRHDNTDFESPNRKLRERLAALGIDVFDLLEPMREAAQQQRLYKPRDSHWNTAGNALAAELIAEHLLESW